MSAPLHVLVIDDSAVVRQTLSALLRSHGGMTVVAATDPVAAAERMQKQRPDVIILDLEMPRMDGLTFLRRLMSSDPIPVVVCSGHVESGSAEALRALEEGAVEVIARPRVGLQGFLYESAVMLVDAVRAAAASARRRKPPLAAAAPRAVPPAKPFSVVAIGASTGGTEAIRAILEPMPATAPGMIIVQHMPEIFTAMFARRLDQATAMNVREAKDGDVITPGTALVAPGNRHAALRRCGLQLRVELSDGPLVSRHRPSINHLFDSVARAAGPSAAGVLLTGMGDDGARGLLELRRSGALTIAQDESSSIVFGMPKVAITLGAADYVLPLSDIPAMLGAPSVALAETTA
jgi:two-component system chemotaxis response regulator CheB